MNAAVPMEPEAPGLFSTMTGWPNRSESFCAIKRAAVSVGPPAGKATTMRTTLSGQAEAQVLWASMVMVKGLRADALSNLRREKVGGFMG